MFGLAFIANIRAAIVQHQEHQYAQNVEELERVIRRIHLSDQRMKAIVRENGAKMMSQTQRVIYELEEQYRYLQRQRAEILSRKISKPLPLTH